MMRSFLLFLAVAPPVFIVASISDDGYGSSTVKQPTSTCGAATFYDITTLWDTLTATDTTTQHDTLTKTTTCTTTKTKYNTEVETTTIKGTDTIISTFLATAFSTFTTTELSVSTYITSFTSYITSYITTTTTGVSDYFASCITTVASTMTSTTTESIINTFTSYVTEYTPTATTLPGHTVTSYYLTTVMAPGTTITSYVTTIITAPETTITTIVPIISTIAEILLFTTIKAEINPTTILATKTRFNTETVVSTAVQTKLVLTTFVSTMAPLYTPISLASISCTSGCQIDVTATKLGYPRHVIVSTVFFRATSVDIYLNSAGQITSSRTTIRLVPPPATTLTWLHSGVTLTYPTIYAAYEEYSHIRLSRVKSLCSSETLSLTLPAPTDFKPLIIPTAAIPNPASAPRQLITYLNSLPIVLSQLGRPIGSGACDPIVGSTKDLATSTLPSVTYLTTVGAIDEVTTITHLALSVNAATPALSPFRSVPTSNTSALVQSNNPALSSPHLSSSSPKTSSQISIYMSLKGSSKGFAPSSEPPASFTLRPASSAPSASKKFDFSFPLIQSSASSSKESSEGTPPKTSTWSSSSSTLTSQTESSDITSARMGTGASALSSRLPPQFTGAAVYTKVYFGGLEGWLIGAASVVAAGIGMEWV